MGYRSVIFETLIMPRPYICITGAPRPRRGRPRLPWSEMPGAAFCIGIACVSGEIPRGTSHNAHICHHILVGDDSELRLQSYVRVAYEYYVATRLRFKNGVPWRGRC